MILEELDMTKTKLIAKSTNEVYETILNGKKCVLKKRIIRENNLSPFWFQLKKLFGLDNTTYFKSINQLHKILNNNIFIPVPELISSEMNENEEYQIFSYEEGNRHEPDEFPKNNNILYQLGQYIGFLHRKEYKCYGTINNPIKEDFKNRLFETMKKTIKMYWLNSKDLLNELEELEKSFNPFHSFSLIMPDISGNQFIYGANKINAIIDMDAYVIGPRELELFVLNGCIDKNDWNIFVKGYQTQREIPNFEEYNGLFSFFCLLNDYQTSQILNSSHL